MAALDARARLLEMDDARAALEAELAAIMGELTSPGLDGAPPVGLSDPLCDAEGFPRADVDVYRVVQKRQRAHCLRTDLKALLVSIEAALAELHGASARPSEPAAPAAGAAASPTASPTAGAAAPPALPFARINEVAAGSPASEGGLVSGDLLLRFGDAHAGNHRGLAALADVVRGNLGKPIAAAVLRKGAAGPLTVTVSVTPQPWSGRGVLGCHFLPV